MTHWEEVLQQVIFPELEKGRPNFDLPHTKAVVHWAKEICTSEPKLDGKVVVTAAYAHDWGYIGLFGKTTNMDEVHRKKELHMERGAEKIERLLHEELADEYTEEEIARVKHLVYVHDRVEELSDEDELALMEADTLGALDTDFVKPTFSAADNRRYLDEQVRDRRRPRFVHARAIEVFEDLLEKREAFYAGK